MNRRFLKLMSLALCGAALAFVSCGSNVKKTEKEEALVKAPAFVADSAYAYTAAQVAFGPRTMGSQAHEACADYLEQMLASFGAKVYRQQFEATLYNGERYPAVNLIGAFNPEARKRVMLCSHWDSRPWADNDPDEKNHHTPILGANDGASGVGVLLEMARQMQQQAPEIGVDLIFFDAEDAGVPQFESYGDEDTWCLGSQFWARRPHVPGYNARFGVLLDMVGGSGATFLQEGYSKEYASAAMKKIWKMADRLGYGNYFPSKNGGYVTDDHVPVNQVAKIPCVDIIPCYEHCEQSSFGPYWHTVDDTMGHIDKATLQAVGQTLMEVIYNEK
jgi:hypothetical protein